VNLLEPFILLRLLAGLTAVVLFVRGAVTAVRVLRHFDVRAATEGQLALEKQSELGRAFVRVAAILQVGALVLSVLAADRLSHSVRGAMCAYGVFHENVWGFPALVLTALVAFVAGVVVQLMALDRTVRGMELVRPLALLSLFMAPLAIADLALTATFLLRLDLSVVASCCSVQLDAGALAGSGFASGPRVVTSVVAVIAVALAALVGWFASLRPRSPSAVLAGVLSLVALPFAVGAIVLEVAPHAFELPQHACPFCLLRADVFGIGFPLFGAVFLAAVWTVGVAVAAVLSRGESAASLAGASPSSKLGGAIGDAFEAFAHRRLRRGAVAWVLALALGVGPVLRYVIVAGGKSLFP
jgi:hypothetical protein